MMQLIKKIIKIIFYILSIDMRNPPPDVFTGVCNCTLLSITFFVFIDLTFNNELKKNSLFQYLRNYDYSTLFIITFLSLFVFYCFCFFGGQRGKKIIEEYNQKNIRYKNTLHVLFPFIWIVLLICLHMVITSFLNQ